MLQPDKDEPLPPEASSEVPPSPESSVAPHQRCPLCLSRQDTACSMACHGQGCCCRHAAHAGLHHVAPCSLCAQHSAPELD